MNKFSLIITTAFLILTATGCEPNGTSVFFKSATTPGMAQQSIGSDKSWKTPQVIDYKIIDNANYHVNQSRTPLYYSMLTLVDPDYGFINFHTRNDGTSNWLHTIMPRNFSAQSWLVDGADIRQINLASLSITDPDVLRPVGLNDVNGNSYVLFGSDTSNGGIYAVYLTKKMRGTNSWTAAEKLIADTTLTTVYARSYDMAADLTGKKTVVWCQNIAGSEYIYYNFINSSDQYRFVNNTTAANQKIDATIQCDPLDYGLDFAFASGGSSGLLAVSTDAANPAAGITLKRWDGSVDGWSSTVPVETITAGAGTLGFPKVHAVSDSSMTVFYYEDIAGAPKLMKSTGSYSGAFAAGTQVDTGIGAGNVFVRYAGHANGSDYVPLVFAASSDKAVVGFIKSDGTTQRLYLSQYSNGSWSQPSAVDLSDGTSNVLWAHADINSSGDIVVGYSKYTTAPVERVFVNYYSSKTGAWLGETSADTLSTLVPVSPATAMTRPHAVIDASGRAVVGFSMGDSTPTRRSVIVTYQ